MTSEGKSGNSVLQMQRESANSSSPVFRHHQQQSTSFTSSSSPHDAPTSSRSISSLDEETKAVLAELPLTQMEEEARVKLELEEERKSADGEDMRLHGEEAALMCGSDVEPKMPSPTLFQGLKQERTSSPSVSEHHESLPGKSEDAQDTPYAAIQFGDFSTYMRHKRQKLNVQHEAWRSAAQSSSGPGGSRPTSNIFAECVIYINGYTTPPPLELNELIVLHGGKVMVYLDSKRAITHIIASNLTPKKHGEFKSYKVIVPEWITDSIREGRLLPWKDYKLGTEVVHSNRGPSGIDSPFGQVIQNPSLKNFFSSGARTESSVPAKDVHETASESDTKMDMSNDFEAHPETPRKRRLHTMISSATLSTSSQQAARLLASPGWRAAHAVNSVLPVTLSANESPTRAREAMAPPAGRGSEDPKGALDMFQEKSRLSHLSLWKAEMQELVRNAAAEANKRLESMDLPAGVSRVIMHVDFDCFFASVALLSHPELRDHPVAVCHGKSSTRASSSEIASCNYLARAAGVFNGGFLGEAKKNCPGLKLLPYEFDKYHEISLKFYSLLLEHSDALEAVSIDEALIDVSLLLSAMRTGTTEGPLFRRYVDRNGSQGDEWTPEKQLAECLRDEIREKTGCEASIGVGSNVLLARLATRKAKPAGSFHITSKEVAIFLDALEIDDLHGWGYKTAAKIEAKFGSKNVGAVKAKASLGNLQALLGPGNGKDLWDNMHGIALDKVRAPPPRNTIGATMNYAIRCPDVATAQGFVRSLATSVSERMKVARCKGKHVRVSVMKRAEGAPVEPPKFMGHGKCDTFDRSSPISDAGGAATDDAERIFAVAWDLVAALNIDPPELRGLSISMSKLDHAEGAAAVTGLAPGQQSLDSFAVKRTRTNAQAQVAPKIEERIDEAPPAGQQLKFIPPTERRGLFDLPTVSQVDQGVLEELPASIRSEVLSHLRQGEGSSSSKKMIEPRPNTRNAASKKLATKAENLSTRSPGSKKQSTLYFAATRTLRSTNTTPVPNAHAPLSRGASPFSDGSRSRTSSRSPIKPVAAVSVADLNPSALSDAMLRTLDIDLKIFRLLSSRDQRDHLLASALSDPIFAQRLPLQWRTVVEAQRASREVHKASVVSKRERSIEADSPSGKSEGAHGAESSELSGPRTRARVDISQSERRHRASLRKGTTDPLLRADRSAASTVLAPSLGRRSAPAKPSTSTSNLKDALPTPYATTTSDDIRALLSSWVGSARAPPRAPDVKRFRDFLVSCLDDAPRGPLNSPRNDPGRVRSVLGWWRFVLQRRWSRVREGEDEGDRCGESGDGDEVGQAWWGSFMEVEREVQRVFRRKFDGAELIVR